MRVKNEAAVIIFKCSLSYLRSDVWKVVAFGFRLEIDTCDVHEDVSKVVFFDTWFKSMIVDIFFIVDVPQSGGEFFLVLAIEFLNFLLHPPVLKHCIFNGDKSAAYILRVFFGLS